MCIVCKIKEKFARTKKSQEEREMSFIESVLRNAFTIDKFNEAWQEARKSHFK